MRRVLLGGGSPPSPSAALRAALEARLRGGFEAVFPFDGARCARMADRVVAGLRTAGS